MHVLHHADPSLDHGAQEKNYEETFSKITNIELEVGENLMLCHKNELQICPFSTHNLLMNINFKYSSREILPLMLTCTIFIRHHGKTLYRLQVNKPFFLNSAIRYADWRLY
jgi:hypothetical protein